MIKHIVVLLIAFGATAIPLRAQDTVQNDRSFWMAMRVGKGFSNVRSFQRWCAQQGVDDVGASAQNNLIGFDLLYNRGRMVYGLSTDFELPSLMVTEPYYFSFAFRGGYRITRHPHLSLKALGGIGVGYAFVRFRNEIPQSLQAAAANYDDPFARAAMLIGRAEVLASYSVPSKQRRTAMAMSPVFYLSAGVSPTIHHGNWNFGETITDIDGNTFNGERVDIPKFYQANWFLTLGVGLSIGRPKH